MKVIVFGATGTIGQKLVEQGLEAGHEVTAFCRNANKLLNQQRANLHTIEGDVFNLADVTRAMEGQEAVCIVLGSGKKRTGVVRSQGTKNIIDAMKSAGISRLICQTTLGAGDSNANLNFFWKNVMFGWFLKEVFIDHELQEQFVRKSGLDWTIVRPGAFTDGAKTGQYREGFAPTDRTVSLKISRADVAHFILNELSASRYLHKTPGLSY